MRHSYIKWFTRPRNAVIAGFILLLLATLFTVFNPRLQTRLLREQMRDVVAEFKVEQVHVLPWSLHISQLDITDAGVRVAVNEATIRFAPWQLLFDVIKINQLTMAGVVIDLRDAPPSEPNNAPMASVFAQLDQGLAIKLADIDVAADVFVDDDVSLRLRISGGGLAPQATGELEVAVVADRSSDQGHFEVAGSVTIAQADNGRVIELGADLLALLAVPQLAEEEVLGIELQATPIEDPLFDADNGEQIGTRVSGDAFQITLSKRSLDAELLRLSANGVHSPAARALSIDYALKANDGLVTAYAADVDLPAFSEQAEGTVAIDLETLKVGVEFSGDMRISELGRVLGGNADLPDSMHLVHTVGADIADGSVQLKEMHIAMQPSNQDAVLSIALSEALSLDLNEPSAVLNDQRRLATLIISDIPVHWFNGLLSEPLLAAGAISGAFELVSGDGALELKPTADFGLSGVSFAAKFELPDTLHFQAAPTLRYAPEALAFSAVGTERRLGGELLTSLDLRARLALDGDALPTPTLSMQGMFDVERLAGLPLLSSHLDGIALPRGLSVNLDGELSANSERLHIAKLAASIQQQNGPRLLSVTALQAFTLNVGSQQPVLNNPEGELALVTVDNIDLAWLDAFVPDLSLSGLLDGVTFTMSAGSDGTVTARSRQPLKLTTDSVSHAAGPSIDDLSLSLRPELDYAPTHWDVRYRKVLASVGKARLLSGHGAVGMTLGDATPGRIKAHGVLDLELGGLAKITALEQRFSELHATQNWHLGLDYDLAGDDRRLDLKTMRLNLGIGGTTYVQVNNDSALVVRTRLEEGEDLAQHVTGTASAVVTALSSQLLADLVPLGNLSFSDLSGHASLQSDGRVLTADLSKAFKLSGARLAGEHGPLLESFSLAAAANVRAVGGTVEATVESLELFFESQPARPALTGSLNFAFEPAHALPLRRMQTKLGGLLPALLNQPLAMPGHSLSSGEFRLDIDLDERGAIAAHAVLDGLVAAEPLAIDHIEARASGKVAADGRGFGFSMPLTGVGQSGQTDGLLVAAYDPGSADKARLNLDFSSAQFLLNDVLSALDSIRPKPIETEKIANGAKPETAGPAQEPDVQAFWDVLPYDTVLKYAIKNLFYTDYVIFNDVAGTITLTSARFTLDALAAHFHASPLFLNGTLDFASAAAQPYELKVEGGVSDFDLNQFFSELVPGTKPRVEGLFSVKFEGFGTSPNMAQYRNELLFDLQLGSEDGLFRPLPPDSGLMIGASDVLGIVGESLSYLPTGGFGAGAVSRLVNYIAVIDYDRINIDITRDATRDIVIKEFLLRSPTISLTAEGGIDYADGKDILDSPLSLDAHLNMSGKGAAILYSMDLLEDETDAFGYYKGPAFHIRGTPAAAESNFAEIINAAADGTVKGAVTRPISGLIGNVKHRWFGDDPAPLEDLQEGMTPAN